MAPVQDFLHSVRSTFSLQWKHLLRPQSGLHIPVIISLQFLLSSLLICIVSGILLSLNFIPDTNPPRDDAGRLLVACSVENDVILYQNGQAQILYKRGEIAYLTYNEATGSIDYPTKDTAAFSPLARRTVIASRAWLSIRDIESSISAGAIIRSLHIWSVDLIMVSLFLTVVLWIHFQTYNSPYMLVWYALLLLLSLIVFSAWSGSILPWTLRSDSALRIVPSLLREYMPFGSALQSFLYNGQEINSASYNRIYSLHSVFSPLFIILLIVLLRRWSGRMPALIPLVVFVIVVSLGLFINEPQTISTQPYHSHVAESINHNESIYPEWYFAGIRYGMDSIPEWIVALILWGLVIGLVSLPLLSSTISQHPRLTQTILRYLIIAGLLTFFIIGILV